MSDNKVYEFFFRRLDGMMPLRKGLDAYALRQKAHASNLANAETPGYKALKVDFEEQLTKAVNRRSNGMTRTSVDHVPVRGGLRAMDKVEPFVSLSDTPKLHNGVNNVDVDMEMARMATNQINHATATKLMQIRFRMLKSSIAGRQM